jgi:hypothetical protein
MRLHFTLMNFCTHNFHLNLFLSLTFVLTKKHHNFPSHKIHASCTFLCDSVGGGQATLTIPGTNIQIPLGPTQPSQQQQQQQSNQNQATSQNQQQQNTQQQGGNSQQQGQNQNQNQQTQQSQNTNQQQNTVITIPGTNNTIQIPANFAGKNSFLVKRD